MKKIINDPADVIEDYIVGLIATEPHLARVEGWPVVVRSAAARKKDRVALVSGGGSGHEPAHAGYVGRGMLDAAVLGPVFTSPSVDAVYAAIRAVATPAGVVLIVKNYTGDRLNFGLAADMARADGIRVDMVIVADDAALGDESRVGRRGLTATVLAHKVAGAAAELGADSEEIVALTRDFLEGAATVGVALGPCFVPGAFRPNFDLGADEIEWGLGIHGEAGSERGPLVPSAEIAERLVGVLIDDLELRAGDEVVVLVNALGGTPDLDLRILSGDVLGALSERGIAVRLAWVGPFLTSLDMPGASLTIARVTDASLVLLMADAEVTAFPRTTVLRDAGAGEVVSTLTAAEAAGDQSEREAEVDMLADVAEAVAAAVVAAEPHLTDLDRKVGDGDLGTNLARGATAVLSRAALLRGRPTTERYLVGVSDILRREVGGTSGPLYSMFLLAMAERLRDRSEADAATWSAAFSAGVARIREVGGAAPGDSTMVDALQPAADALQAAPGTGLRAAVAAAHDGAESTAALRPSLGRSSYVGERAVGVPDPGAVAIALQLAEIARVVEARSPSC
ncbi:dihydroxyacetone kinase family protein [Microbacterium sediminicola]|uniref:Dihydroxyacetone kinase family protein n=1 Tax=Microbacterium sediminicola TaxID=415210 RepID=A0ABP4UEH1_9MICO